MSKRKEIDELVSDLKASGTAFALATVVRTVSVTAAKAGAKAVIRADGSISGGWIGGGCARTAVLNAAREAIESGGPRLISVQPEDLLDEHGVAPGETKDGIRFARNMCPSKGTMDIFVEPILPKAELIILGASPVAVALADLGRKMAFSICVCARAEDQSSFEEADRRIEGFTVEPDNAHERYVVITTQGNGDEAALKSALLLDSRYVGFVGSRKKMQFLREKLLGEGVAPEVFDRVKGPAGLDLGAITPDEIALSIIAEIIERRRHAQLISLVADGQHETGAGR